MPLATLLVLPDVDNQRWRDVWEFDHAFAHREYYAVMAPLTRFSALPYFIEPLPPPTPPFPTDADDWNLNHQQAHNDFALALPAFYNDSSIGFGIPNSQNLVDSNLNDPETRTWWTFANHQEHYIANNAILPLPTTVAPNSPLAPGWWNEIYHPVQPGW